MPSRSLDLHDLESTAGLSDLYRGCARSHRRSRCFDDYVCSPCSSSTPRRKSLSPSYRRRKSCLVPNAECSGISERGIKSGRMVCDNFSSVCYPRNCYRDTPSWCYSPKTCYRTSKCDKRPDLMPCRYPSSSPCLSDEYQCDNEPSSRFVAAMNDLGQCTSRFDHHFCPWEANVTVSGVIRAHCSSTADEVSNRLSGPFKAFGKRFTTDSECNWCTTTPREQKLSLGAVDDGGSLDFTRNNRIECENSSLETRIKRITEPETKIKRRSRTRSSSSGGNHVSWDSSVDYYDSEGDTRGYDRCNSGRGGYSSDDADTTYYERTVPRKKRFNIGVRLNDCSSHSDTDKEEYPKKGCLKHYDESSDADDEEKWSPRFRNRRRKESGDRIFHRRHDECSRSGGGERRHRDGDVNMSKHEGRRDVGTSSDRAGAERRGRKLNHIRFVPCHRNKERY